MQPLTTTELLQAELAAVTGERCGWTCANHHGDNFPRCERAKGHVGAQALTDVHVGWQPAEDVEAARQIAFVIATECCAS
jgi:hypothetical protein